MPSSVPAIRMQVSPIPTISTCATGTASVVYQATSRDPLVLAGVVVAMALLGLLATWIPARRALSVDLMILLREE
jgi:ABC-type lipoprotein release transport system permease subunit